MPVARKSEQVISYLKTYERVELDEAAAELEVSRADLIRQCIVDYLDQRRERLEQITAAGDVIIDGATA